MPLRVHLHIREIKAPTGTIQKGNYIVSCETKPYPIPFSSKCDYDEKSGTVRCANPVEVSAGRRYGTLISILLKTNVTPSTEISRISLPLEWFPADYVVTEWFPMKAISAYPNGLMIQLTVHIAKRFQLPPFSVPPGRLLVLPAWDRPTRPAIPPAPYFYPKPPGHIPLTVPPAPYPSGDPPAKNPEATKQPAHPSQPSHPPPTYLPQGYPQPGYPPPPQAYPPHLQGYPSPSPQGYPSPPVQGYPPQGQGYPAPPPQGYPPQAQGYPAPPPQGYPPQAQGYPAPPPQAYPGFSSPPPAAPAKKAGKSSSGVPQAPPTVDQPYYLPPEAYGIVDPTLASQATPTDSSQLPDYPTVNSIRLPT